MSEQKEKTLTPKAIFVLALLKKGYNANNEAQIPKVLFEQNEKECKENGITSLQSLLSTLATLPKHKLATKQKVTYNEKIVTAYIPL